MKVREEIINITIFAVGIILVPVGLLLWLYVPPSGTVASQQLTYLHENFGPTTYMLGLIFLAGAWLDSVKHFKITLPTFFVIGLVLSIVGYGLNESSKTQGYEPMLLSGLSIPLSVTSVGGYQLDRYPEARDRLWAFIREIFG